MELVEAESVECGDISFTVGGVSSLSKINFWREVHQVGTLAYRVDR